MLFQAVDHGSKMQVRAELGQQVRLVVRQLLPPAGQPLGQAGPLVCRTLAPCPAAVGRLDQLRDLVRQRRDACGSRSHRCLFALRCLGAGPSLRDVEPAGAGQPGCAVTLGLDQLVVDHVDRLAGAGHLVEKGILLLAGDMLTPWGRGGRMLGAPAHRTGLLVSQLPGQLGGDPRQVPLSGRQPAFGCRRR